MDVAASAIIRPLHIGALLNDIALKTFAAGNASVNSGVESLFLSDYSPLLTLNPPLLALAISGVSDSQMSRPRERSSHWRGLLLVFYSLSLSSHVRPPFSATRTLLPRHHVPARNPTTSSFVELQARTVCACSAGCIQSRLLVCVSDGPNVSPQLRSVGKLSTSLPIGLPRLLAMPPASCSAPLTSSRLCV